MAKRIYNQFDLVTDTGRHDGLIHQEKVENYIDKALATLSEKNAVLKSVRLDEDTGRRTVSYAYHGPKKTQDGIKAVLSQMPAQVFAKLGYKVDDNGNLVNTDGNTPPFRITDRGRKQWTELSERILDPRTLASIRAQIHDAGGRVDHDKVSGVTNMLIPGTMKGLAGKVQSLTKSMNERYLAGLLPSSALADGSSPATVEERARAQVARQANIQDARSVAVADYIRQNPGSQLAKKMQQVTDRETRAKVLKAERMPGTREFDNKVFRHIRASEARQRAVQKYIALYPKSRLAKKMHSEQNEARNQRFRNFAGNVAHISRNALILIVGTILTAVNAGVGLLSKAFTVISQIGGDVRKRAINEATYNFEPGTLEAFEKFSAQRLDIDKDLLKRAAGGFHKAWSTPLNYTEGAFNQLAPYLREGIVKLLSMSTVDGDKNVFRAMGLVIDDYVDKSLKGIGGIKPFDPTTKEGRHAAYSANVSALGEHNEAMGLFMDAYWNDFMKTKKTRIEDWKVADMNGNLQIMTFEKWITQGAWNPEYATKSGIDTPIVRTAADRTNQLLQQFLGTYRNLANDIGLLFQSQISNLIEFLRNNLTNMIASYFPVFAQKENQRAEQFIGQSQSFIERVLPGYEKEALKHLRGTFYSGSLEEFKPIYEAIKRGETTAIPSYMDRDALIKILPALTNYYKALSYKKRIEDEIAKGEAIPDHILMAIHVNSETFAAESMFEAMMAQRKMVVGAKNTRNKRLPVGVRGNSSAFTSQAVIAAKILPGLVASAFKRAANAAHNKELASKEEALARNLEHFAAWGGDGKTYWHETNGKTYLYTGDKSKLQGNIENIYRWLLNSYRKDGNRQAYKDTLVEFRDFLMGIEITPEQYEEVLGREAEFKRRVAYFANLDFFSKEYAEEFARHSMDLTSLEKAFLLEERLRQIEADEAFVAVYGSREARADLQSRTSGFGGATTLIGDVKQEVKKQYDIDFDEWMADKLHSILFDVADGTGDNTSIHDVVVNFIDERDHKKSFPLYLKNNYGMVRDFHIKGDVNHVEMSSAFLDAASITEMEQK